VSRALDSPDTPCRALDPPHPLVRPQRATLRTGPPHSLLCDAGSARGWFCTFVCRVYRRTPFYSSAGPTEGMRLVLSGDLRFPLDFDPGARELVSALLETEPAARLGSGPEGAKGVQEHQWFAGVDWSI
jgi:hypothetical protein